LSAEKFLVYLFVALLQLKNVTVDVMNIIVMFIIVVFNVLQNTNFFPDATLSVPSAPPFECPFPQTTFLTTGMVGSNINNFFENI